MNDSEELLTRALRLPERARADLAKKLLDSLDADSGDEIDDAWAAEIERRCLAVDEGNAVTSDWDEFRQRIEREIFGR